MTYSDQGDGAVVRSDVSLSVRGRFHVIVGVGAVLAYLVLGLLLSRQWAGAVLPWVAPAVPIGLSVAASVLFGVSSFSEWVAGPAQQSVQLWLWSAASGSLAALLLDAFGLRAALAAVVGVLVTVVGRVRYRRVLDVADAEGTRLLRGTGSLEDSQRVIAAARRQLGDATMTPQMRTNVRFNLARSLTDQAAMTQDLAALLEGSQILSELLAEDQALPGMPSVIATELVGVKSMLASITGEMTGWQEALDTQLAIAHSLRGQPEVWPSVVVRAHLDQADLHSFLLSRIGGEGDQAPPAAPGPASSAWTQDDLDAWERELDAAIAAVERARQAAPSDSPIRPELDLKLGMFAGQRDIDEGVRLVRLAYEAVRGRQLRRHEDVQLGLALLLSQRARLALEEDEPTGAQVRRARADLDEAVELAERLSDRGHYLAPQAAVVLADLAELAELVEMHKPAGDVEGRR